ncbi:anti-sigma factor [Alteromonas sp. ASW11-19]|uniref:Anti-sigma factor n=1 Tax=Alteromonas salexigens TaxID=2982530 RepID=A0ABT2VQI3_9ALTE|nr:anti-sigma factor [Alteromonas salexigens]MCU7555339.1 anti-sigma factor [Alteromonas salexigens]
MNYLAEERRNALAAEYVLGTLRGQARRRYQKLMMESQLISETTWLWEQYLNGLGESVPPVSPSSAVWENIQSRLGFTDSEADNQKVISLYQKRSRRWRTMTGVAAAAAFIIAVLFGTSEPPVTVAPTHIAVVNNADAEPLWLIEVSPESLTVRSTAKLTERADKDFELWMVPANGQAPISLGVLPEDGRWDRATPAILLRPDIAALAVSLEPPGGSPTGAPTEVLYISPLVSV